MVPEHIVEEFKKNAQPAVIEFTTLTPSNSADSGIMQSKIIAKLLHTVSTAHKCDDNRLGYDQQAGRDEMRVSR